MVRGWKQRIGRRGALGAATSLVGVLILGQSGVGAAARISRPAPAWPALTRAEAGALSSHVSARVIVILRDQAPRLPADTAHEAARSAAFAAAQRPLLAELAETRATHIHAYRLIDAVAATVSPAEARRLAHDPAVRQVVPDVTIRMTPPALAATPVSGDLTAPAAVPPDNACPSWVQLNPQADETVNAVSGYKPQPTAASLGYTGEGVKVGFIADGIDVNNPNFIRPDGQHVFVDYRDFSGDGTATPTDGREAFLDAGSIAAQGTVVYDVSHYTDLPSAVPCRIRIEGVAPGVSLVGLDVIGNSGGAPLSVLVQAVDWAVTYDHVNVLNESIGGSSFPDVEALDAFDMADDAAVAAGVTVVASSGDAGPGNTIGSPASDPNVISVGASTTYRIYAQTGLGAAQRPGVTGWLNNNTSPFSSSGETETGRTIDLVAPGDYNWLPCSTDVAIYKGCRNDRNQPTPFQAIGGTSESSPVAAGVAALVIQAYREAHAGATPVPSVVKRILLSTANPIGAPADQQGSGLLDAYRAVLAARSYGLSASQASGETTLLSPNQIDVSAIPASPEALTETVTNSGASTQTIVPWTQTLGPWTPVASATVVLSDQYSPHAVSARGKLLNIEKVTFTVPPGENRLSASIAFKTAGLSSAGGPSLYAPVGFNLVDPQGRLAIVSEPGPGNYGNAQVSKPVPGAWTAYIFGNQSGAGGTTGPVLFGASVAAWQPLGSVSPASLTLAPGQSGTITVQAATPSTPGDQAASLMLQARVAGSTMTNTTSVPIILRSLVPTGPTSFGGVLTGGNGRSPFTGQTAYYQVQLSAGEPELNASITLAGKARDPFTAELVSPTGTAEAVASNAYLAVGASGLTGVPTPGAELHVLTPVAGTWDLIIDFNNAVSGTALSEPYTVMVDESAVPVTASGLPDSVSTVLASGTPVQAAVTVTNTGTAPQAYFVDARFRWQTTLSLKPLGGLPVTSMPNSRGVFYVVPTGTSGITWEAQASMPIVAEVGYLYGVPDVVGQTAGISASGFLSGSPLSQGPWAVTPQPVGPDGAQGVPSSLAVTSMQAQTSAFDIAVTSPTGDLWRLSINPHASMDLIVVQPGQTAQIPVTITPKAAVGTLVQGTLFVDVADLLAFGLSGTPDADQVAALPYEYTVGPAGS